MFWANKGKGKAKGTPEPPKPAAKPSGQRNISAFFAKAPAAKAADDDDAEEQTPAKRARVEAVAEASPAAEAPEPMRVDAPPVPLAPLPIPASDAARHAHFAERLSLGVQTRNGQQRDVLQGVPFSEYGRDAGPAGPYTPLEKQIVALKRANPGILLMIEVRGAQRSAAPQSRSPAARWRETLPLTCLLFVRLATSTAFSEMTPALRAAC